MVGMGDRLVVERRLRHSGHRLTLLVRRAGRLAGWHRVASSHVALATPVATAAMGCHAALGASIVAWPCVRSTPDRFHDRADGGAAVAIRGCGQSLEVATQNLQCVALMVDLGSRSYA